MVQIIFNVTVADWDLFQLNTDAEAMDSFVQGRSAVASDAGW
jgi:hypothetical protein